MGILNQGYWKETTETLTLVLSAVVVCMGIGVPLGIAAAHRPRRCDARHAAGLSYNLTAITDGAFAPPSRRPWS